MSGRSAAVIDDLLAAGVLREIDPASADAELFVGCDVASNAENRLGLHVDPRTLSADERLELAHRTSEDGRTYLQLSTYQRAFWFLADGECVGGISFDESAGGGPYVRLSSLYTFPEHRRCSHGRNLLAAIGDAARAHALGYRLGTHWSWTKNVRYYLALGLWVQSWKHSLVFLHDRDTAPPIVDIEGDEVRLGTMVNGRRVELITARRRGDWLEMSDVDETLWDAEDTHVACAHADSMLAVHLAVGGWPLVRSPEAWERWRYGDAGVPESLARRIQYWEAFERSRGFLVETPRIAGLAYPTWEELNRA